MKYKNVIKTVPLFFTAITIPLVSAACNPKQPRVYFVGSEWEMYDLNIKFDSFDYKSVDDYFEIHTTFTFTPLKSEFVLEKDFMFIHFVDNYLGKIFPNEEKSIEISKFNVFSTISNKTTCTYVFDLSNSLFTDKTWEIWFSIYFFDRPDSAMFSIDFGK